MATMKEVAKRAGVSVATVSAVINTDSGVNVSPELTERVQKAVKEMNYRPNRIARALSKKETHTIAYILPSITNEFFAQMAHFIEDYAFERGYGVYLCNTHSKIERVKLYQENLIENRVAGVITTLTWEILENNFITNISNEEIPVVGLAGARIIDNIDTVTINDCEGTKKAVQYLLKQGHTNIGFIGLQDSKTTEERLRGYKQALEEANVRIKDENIVLGTEFTREEGFNLAGKLFKQSHRMTALFVYNDLMSAGVIDKFNAQGIKVPEDVAVVGYDDSVANYVRPKLTTMSLPKKQMVNSAMNILFNRIKRNSQKIQHIKVRPKLIRRDSA